MKIVADAHIPYIKGVLEPYAEVVYLPGREISPAHIKDADAMLVRTRTRCDGELLEGSSVKFIGTATIGTDHIDTGYCVSRGIEVVSAAGSNARGVLQWVSAALDVLARSDGWRPADITLGIVGVGHVGSLVRDFALSWGFRVLCSDPPREISEGLGRENGFVPLGEIASAADIITFHTPLTHQGPHRTCGLAGWDFFRAAKPGAAVINSARGGIVDEAILKLSIAERGLKACLDTWVAEPDIDRELLRVSLTATTHIAGYTIQGKANASAMTVGALARHFNIPLSHWHPLANVDQVRRSGITWCEMSSTIKKYCDIESQTAVLKSNHDKFESLREDYRYREEYF